MKVSTWTVSWVHNIEVCGMALGVVRLCE